MSRPVNRLEVPVTQNLPETPQGGTQSPDARQVIANVLRAAIKQAEDDAYLHGAWNSRPEIDVDEVAAAVDAALGGLTRRQGLEEVMTPSPTEFWHCWATPWVRTCTCTAPDYQDEHCPIHGAVGSPKEAQP